MADITLKDADKEMTEFQDASNYKKAWIEQAKEDYRYVIGDQWEATDKELLKKAGKPALTLNKIQPLIFLISGIQRQNRSDFKAFPIGEEDSIKADAITYLLKDMVRYCDGDFKMSESFEDGIICGEGWIEPFIDYGSDLINGDMKLKKRVPTNVFLDPASKEYDHSDARYIFVETPNISKAQLLQLFPEKEEEINLIVTDAKDFTTKVGKIIENETDYPEVGENRTGDSLSGKAAEKLPYQLIEKHFYKNSPRYLLVNPYAQEGEQDVFIFEEKAKADKARASLIETMGDTDEDVSETIKIIKRFVKVPWIKAIVNEKELDTFISPFYPRYKKITIFSFYAHWVQAPIEKNELLIQGIVNSLKDPQSEINKRRSQELHHLNSSTNSGWLNKKKGGITNKEAVEKYGSSSGFIVDYDKEKPERIHPMQLSSGHEALANLSNNDIKEISGLNTDLLAQNDKASSSGRAIHLRQKQGLMMIQRILDNFSRTKREIGRFLLSMISEVYDTKKAIRAIGESWVKKHFEQPVMTQRLNPQTGEPMVGADGQPEMIPEINKETGKMKMVLDEEGVQAFFNMILNDASMDRYDVVVSEVATSETVKMANYTQLLELRETGVPVPPDVLVDESMLSPQAKEKIKKSFQAQQQAAAQMQQSKQQKGK